jgi:hypothetical protein
MNASAGCFTRSKIDPLIKLGKKAQLVVLPNWGFGPADIGLLQYILPVSDIDQANLYIFLVFHSLSRIRKNNCESTLAGSYVSPKNRAVLSKKVESRQL